MLKRQEKKREVVPSPYVMGFFKVMSYGEKNPQTEVRVAVKNNNI